MIHIFSLPLYVRVEKNIDDFLKKCANCSNEEIQFLEACNIPIRMFGQVSDIRGSHMTVRYHDDSRSLNSLEKNMLHHYGSACVKHVDEVNIGGFYVFGETSEFEEQYYRVKVIDKDFFTFTLLAIDYGFLRSVRYKELRSFFPIDPQFYLGSWHFAMAAVIHEPDAYQMKLLRFPRFNSLITKEQTTGDVFFFSSFEPMCGVILPFDFDTEFDMKKLINSDEMSLKWLEACSAASEVDFKTDFWSAPMLHPFNHKTNTVATTMVNVESNMKIHFRDMLTSLRLICLEEIMNKIYGPKNRHNRAKVEDDNDLDVGNVVTAFDNVLQRYYRVKITQRCPVYCVNIVGLDYPICKQTTVPFAELLYLNAQLSELPIMYQEFTFAMPIVKKGLFLAEMMIGELIPSGSVVGIQNAERMTFFYDDAIRDLELTLRSIKGLCEIPEKIPGAKEYKFGFTSVLSNAATEKSEIYCAQNTHNTETTSHNTVSSNSNTYLVGSDIDSTSGYNSANGSDHLLNLTALPPNFQRVYCMYVNNAGSIFLRTKENAEMIKKLNVEILNSLQAQKAQPYPRFEWKYLTDLFIVVVDDQVHRARFEPDGQCLFIDDNTKCVLNKTHKLFKISETYARIAPFVPREYRLFPVDSHLELTSDTYDLILKSDLYAEDLPYKKKCNLIRIMAKQINEGKTVYVDVAEHCRLHQIETRSKSFNPQ